VLLCFAAYLSNVSKQKNNLGHNQGISEKIKSFPMKTGCRFEIGRRQSCNSISPRSSTEPQVALTWIVWKLVASVGEYYRDRAQTRHTRATGKMRQQAHSQLLFRTGRNQLLGEVNLFCHVVASLHAQESSLNVIERPLDAPGSSTSVFVLLHQ